MAHSSPISAYADAQSLLVRLEERRRLSPVRFPLRTRMRIAERQALARLDNLPLHDDDLLIDGRGSVQTSGFDLSHGRHAIGSAIELDAILNDSMVLLQWLGAIADPAITASSTWQRAVPDMLDTVAGWQQDIATLPPSPPLLHGAQMARLWRERAPAGRGDLVYSLLIGDRWGPGCWDGSAGGLIALGLERNALPWKNARGEQLESIWLDAVGTGAQMHLDLEVRLRAYAARAAQFINSRKRPGRLKDVLSLAMSRPRISSKDVAKALNLTVAGAIKLLSIATDAGLLIERTGQASYRSYAIPVTAPSEAGSRMRPDPFPTSPARLDWSDDDELGFI